MKKSTFFQKISELSNYASINIVQKIYWAILRFIVRELHDNGEVFLPEFGRFYLSKKKTRRIHDVNTGVVRNIPPSITVHFRPAAKVKQYFKEYGKRE